VQQHAAALGPIDLSSGSGFFGNTPIAGAFVDTLTFTLTNLSIFNGSVTGLVNGTQDVDFTSIVLTPGALNFLPVLGDPVEVRATPSAGFVLSPGAELNTCMLLRAGLGAVGLLSRRRRTS
jgi:hypothetical protein